MVVNLNGKGLTPNVNIQLSDWATFAGFTYRYSTPLTTFASPAWMGLSFKTPKDYFIAYSFLSYSKTGDDVYNVLYESPTVDGVSQPANYQNLDQTSSNGCPLINPIFGTSTGGMTFTGGTEIASSYVPGLGNGQNQTGSAITALGIMLLKPDTVYGIKFTALGGTTKLLVVSNIDLVPKGAI